MWNFKVNLKFWLLKRLKIYISSEWFEVMWVKIDWNRFFIILHLVESYEDLSICVTLISENAFKYNILENLLLKVHIVRKISERAFLVLEIISIWTKMKKKEPHKNVNLQKTKSPKEKIYLQIRVFKANQVFICSEMYSRIIIYSNIFVYEYLFCVKENEKKKTFQKESTKNVSP